MAELAPLAEHLLRHIDEHRRAAHQLDIADDARRIDGRAGVVLGVDDERHVGRADVEREPERGGDAGGGELLDDRAAERLGAALLDGRHRAFVRADFDGGVGRPGGCRGVDVGERPERHFQAEIGEPRRIQRRIERARTAPHPQRDDERGVERRIGRRTVAQDAVTRRLLFPHIMRLYFASCWPLIEKRTSAPFAISSTLLMTFHSSPCFVLRRCC
jgi:hypothetical protein